jgi:hypothetical protein
MFLLKQPRDEFLHVKKKKKQVFMSKNEVSLHFIKIKFETLLCLGMNIKNIIYLVNQTVFSLWLGEK